MVAAYKVIKRCIKANCRGTAISGSVYCEEHQLKPKRQINNPQGYNKHKVNPVPIEPILTQIEEFAKKTDQEQKEIIAKLGNELYMIRKVLRPKLVQFTKYRDYYEAKHFGWDWEE